MISKSTRDEASICYLCGEPLYSGECNEDHVPPKQLYSKEIRGSQNVSRLLVLRTHKVCNESYSLDEQYFVHTFIPIAIGSPAGNSLWTEIRSKYAKGEYLSLHHKGLAEFQERPSGLVLPSGKMIKRFDSARVWRVVWKITRGLFFEMSKKFLPEDNPRGFDLAAPGETPPTWFPIVASQPSLGVYPSVFDYKYARFEYSDYPRLVHVLAMLFWERLSMITTFEDPSCKDEQSKS